MPTVSLKGYITIKDSTYLTDVDPPPSANGTRGGKLKSKRHFINRCRLYKRKELDALLNKMLGDDFDANA
jgi:hypothetical protein